MFKLFKNALYISLPLFIVGLLLQSCNKTNVNPPQQLPQITSLSPASGKAFTAVTIKGINLKNVSDVKFGTAEAAGFNASNNTDSAINVIVPDSLPLGDTYIQVYLSNGGGYASHKFTVLLTPPVPKIDSVSPNKALPGTILTISGNNFSLVTSVKFSGVAASFSPTLDTNSRMNVTVPWNATGGSQYITLTNPNGSDSVLFTVDPSPVITSVDPVQAAAGDIITVKGVAFTGATSVLLGTTATSYTISGDTMITFPVPAASGTGKVTVTTPNGFGISANAIVVQVAGLKLPIFDEALEAGFSKYGGWGGVADYANTTPVESGSYSLAINYSGGYGSPAQIGASSIDLSQYTTFKISVYGGPGSNGKSINIGFNSADDPTNYNTTDGKTITLVEGQWTDFQIPIADIISSTNITKLTQIVLKEYSGITGTETIYVDNMGLN